MKNDPVLFSSNYCHCEGAGYAEVSSAPILNCIVLSAEVSKMAIRVRAGGYAHGGGSAVASVCLSVRLSVCPLRCELVSAALADLNEIFGGGQGWCQARLSPESAQSVKVRVRKGREI